VISETFDDGAAHYGAVCEHGLEGVVAKKRLSRYRSGDRGWIEVKHPDYWRGELEREAMQRSRDRRKVHIGAADFHR
jgi:ATP-dependent DNA ligase